MKHFFILFALIFSIQLSAQTFVRHNEGNAPDNTQALAIDSDGKVWVAQSTAFSGSLDYYHEGEWHILNLESDHLISSNVQDMIAKDGIIYIASGLLTRLNWNDQIYEKFEVNNEVINSLTKDWANNELYYGKTSSLYKQIDSQNVKVSSFWGPSALVFDDQHQTLWAATSFYGLYKLTNDTIINYNIYPGSEIEDIDVDSKGDVWMAIRNKGLVHFDGETLTAYNSSNSDLPNDKPSILTVDKNDGIWFGGYSYDALSHFNGNSFRHYTPDIYTDFPTANIRQMEVDDNNTLWMATSYGLIEVTDLSATKTTTINRHTSIYPNPTSSAIQLYFEDVQAIEQISITNALGQHIHSFSPNMSLELEYQLPREDGLYLLSVQKTDGSMEQFRIIKNNSF